MSLEGGLGFPLTSFGRRTINARLRVPVMCLPGTEQTSGGRLSIDHNEEVVLTGAGGLLYLGRR